MMKKRFLAILTCLTLFLQISFVALAENSQSVFFDAVMDLDVVNGIDKNNSEREFQSTPAKPNKKTETINGNTIEYAEFNKTSDTSVYGYRISPDGLLGIDTMTVRLWAKPYSTDENIRTMFSISRTNISNSVFYAAVKENSLIVYLNGETASADITDYMNKWSQYTFIRSYDTENEKASVKAYINMTEVLSLDIDAVNEDLTGATKFFYVGTPGAASAGTNNNLPNVYRGGISEFYVYDKALSNSQILQDYLLKSEAYGLGGMIDGDEDEPQVPDTPTEEGVLVDLDFSKEITDDAITISGNPTVTKSVIGANGESYGYANFNADGYIEINEPEILNAEESSFEFWLSSPVSKTSSGGNVYAQFLNIAEGETASLRFELQNYRDEQRFQLKQITDGDSGVVSYANYVDKWTHLVVSRIFGAELVTYRIYLDGKLKYENTRELTDDLKDSDMAKIYIAGLPVYSGEMNRFKGQISTVKIYNKELAADEVEEKYAAKRRTYEVSKLTVDGEIKVSDGSITVSTGTNTPAQALADGIEIINKNTGKAFFADVTENGENELLVTFNQHLKYGSRLQLYSRALDTYALMNVEQGLSKANITLYDESLNQTELNGQDMLYLRIALTNSGTDGKTYKYTIIARDENGCAVSAESDSGMSVGGGSTEANVISMSNLKDACSLYVYVWEQNGGILKPIYNSPQKFEVAGE